jgi:hypothetical protein
VTDDSAPNLFEGPVPPRDEYVLGQGFMRDPVYCKGVLPDERMWPAELDQLPVNSNGRIRIDRKLVFSIAQRATARIAGAVASYTVARCRHVLGRTARAVDVACC